MIALSTDTANAAESTLAVVCYVIVKTTPNAPMENFAPKIKPVFTIEGATNVRTTLNVQEIHTASAGASMLEAVCRSVPTTMTARILEDLIVHSLPTVFRVTKAANAMSA